MTEQEIMSELMRLTEMLDDRKTLVAVIGLSTEQLHDMHCDVCRYKHITAACDQAAGVLYQSYKQVSDASSH